jgi:hypothetical protein
MVKAVIMHDWDGTDVDTMPSHADLAAKVIEKHFGMDIVTAREEYLATTGIPFDGQLEKIFPNSQEKDRRKCAKEYHKRKLVEVYGNPKTFPGLSLALELSEFFGFESAISSSTEARIIKPWAAKEHLQKYFVAILGKENNTKRDHINHIKSLYPGVPIFFLSDSVGDMNLPAATIGVCVPRRKHKEFYRAGANWVFSSPPTVEVIKRINSIF